jgi:hypothetical protein
VQPLETFDDKDRWLVSFQDAVQKQWKDLGDQPHVVDFGLVLDLHIEEEVGTIRSAEVQERLQPLPDNSRKCFSEQLAGMTFDGADIAFEGPVIYAMRAIAR